MSDDRTFSPQPGTLYSIADGEGQFAVVKVLAIDERGVHLRLYGDRFAERSSVRQPQQVQPTSGTGALAIGHFPVLRGGFIAADPVFLLQAHVATDELDGYDEWAAANGGYFTDVTIAIQSVAGAMSRIREYD